MHLTHCKLSRKTQLRLLEYFVLEVTARSAGNILEIHPNSAALFYTKIRNIIAYHLEREAHEIFDGEIELDESYFGARRKEKRGRGAEDKLIVFGLLKRNNRVYTVVVEDTRSNTLMPVIKRKGTPDSIVYTDHWHSYNALDIVGFTHYRINHSKHFSHGNNHINGIENFWNQAKRVLRKYNGIPKQSFHLFIKKCEFRSNCGTPKAQLKILRSWAKI